MTTIEPLPDAEALVADRREEVQRKLERVRAVMEREQLDGVLLSKQLLVSWVGAGLNSAVVRGADPGFVRVLITADDAFVVTQNIEGVRLAVEDPPERLGLELVQLPWYGQIPEDFALQRVSEARLGNDGLGPGRPIESALLHARLELLPTEQRRLRALGADATQALETTVREVTRGTTEREVAAELARRLELDGIFPSVLMVGADQRRRQFRHPLANGAVVERDVLAVLCVERDGLYVAVSRSASVGEVDRALAERHRTACEVEAELILATAPGSTYQEVLDLGLAAYASRGYPDEWKLHYQGGPIGYGSREALVAPASADAGRERLPVVAGGACAWNPTVQGAKSEDTFIVGDDGPELITETRSWPMISCPVDAGPFDRPAILELDG
jgi:Xaa-Pro aminopeptidase